MSPTFDAYYKWLAIPPAEQPPNHYRLLALNLFEPDADVIATAADQRMAHVRSFQSGQYVDASQRLLNELAGARICLLRADKKAAYDAALRATAAKQAAAVAPPPAPPMVAMPVQPAQLVAPPLNVDYSSAPIVQAPAESYPSHAGNPAPARWAAEINPPENVPLMPPQTATAEPATSWQHDDDPLGLDDPIDRISRNSTLVRPRKPSFPRIFFLAPLAGVALVIGAVAYRNINDAMQDLSNVDSSRRTEKPAKHSKEIALHPGGSGNKLTSGSNSKTNSDFTQQSSGDNATSSFPSGIPDSSSTENPAPDNSFPTSPEEKKPTAARLPVPDSEAQRKTLLEIRNVYKDEFAKATTIEGRAALVKKFEELAANPKEDPTIRYVLATQALEIAVKLGDLKRASELVSGLSLFYDVDTWELKAKTLSQLATVTKTPEARQLVASGAYDLVNKALAEERYDAAVQLAANAADLAATLRDTAFRKKTIEAHTRAMRMQHEAAEVQAAQERLARQSDDAAAHLLIGRFFCMEKDDWDSGLPHLVRCSDPDLSALAQRELAGAAQTADQVALAEAWWDLADRRHDAGDAPLVKGMRNRAVYWYRRAMPQLSGFGQSKAQKRIAEATATTPAKP